MPAHAHVRRPRLIHLACLLVIMASPPARAGVKGLLLVPEVISSPGAPAYAHTPSPRRSLVHLAGRRGGSSTASGARPRPRVGLIHGANPGGKDDPRIVGPGRSLARAGRRGLVPQLSLGFQRLDLTETGQDREAVSFLAGPTRAKVGVLAFSYGAGLTLVALADQPAIQAHVAFVATVGT